MTDWRAIPYTELDATADKWLMCHADGTPIDDSPRARAKRAWAAGADERKAEAERLRQAVEAEAARQGNLF